ncbi:uncharacterized protein LOC113384419 [Ctenocephalides felis]|uniref:uncharacterized protein LOC113384419 n=1 Tax=Ctenocephalides felis TaxID=7515 RepID=UPI000E6E2BFC|nr:uncharacterized protein LOC113384419 [Ctenocephalides felis]
MDLDMSDDNIFETSMDSDENILETNIGALENSFISAKSSTSCEQVFADGLITKSNFTSSELDFDTFSKFRDNDFTYMLPKSFLGKVSHMVPMPKIISVENKDPKIDFVVSLMNGDFLVLKEGFPLARCCIGFPAEQILIHPVMIHQELHLYFILSNNDKVTIVELLGNELQVMKKYKNVIKYDIVPEDNHNEIVLFNLKLYYNESSHKLDIFKLYTDEIGEESLNNQTETFEQLKHDLRFTQDLLESKQKLLRKQIELKEEIFEDLVLSNNSSSSTKTYLIILKTNWVYICNQKLVIGFVFGNTTRSVVV